MEAEPQRTEGGDGDSRERTSRWDNKVDFFMAAISSTVGLSNLWRFPYIAYNNGGGAFLIPYFLAHFFIGFPLVTMQLALGQYGRKGIVRVWTLCPIFEGIGWSMLIMNFLFMTYYVMLIAYCIFYIAASFTSTLPWATCSNVWNADNCVEGVGEPTIRWCNHSSNGWVNEFCNPDNLPRNRAVSPAEEYFNRCVLGQSDGIDELGGVQWPLALCLLLAWKLIALGLSFGTKSWGKFSYVTTLLPYILMTTLLIQAFRVPGAKHGIMYFITPTLHRLGDGKPWQDAVTQVVFSLGCAWGTFITIGKHNQFRNNPIVDAGILVLIDFFTNIFCGVVIFAILGQMSYLFDVPIEAVVTGGISLAFVVYPHAVTALPLPQLWSVLFFLMLKHLGLGSAIAQVENVLGALTEEIEVLNSRRNRQITLLCLAFVSFLLGLIYTTNGGIYFLTVMDSYGPGLSEFVICFFGAIAVAWIYGSGRLLSDIAAMTGWRSVVLHFFTVCWRVTIPKAMLTLIIVTSIQWSPLRFGSYIFPEWADYVGWMVTSFQLLPIPVLIIYKLCIAIRRQETRDLIRPTADWGVEARQNGNTNIVYSATQPQPDEERNNPAPEAEAQV